MKMIKYPCVEGWDTQGYSNAHRTLDFSWLTGYSSNGKTPIVACDEGTVEFEGFYPQYFNGKKYNPIGVVIRHTTWSDEFDYFSIYWHLSETFVNIGDHVEKGAEIGRKGDTGMAQGVHLHFQVIKVNKGAALPDQHTKDNWTALSINPTDMIEVYDGQVFKYTGNFDLAHHSDSDDIDSIKEENASLKAENKALKEAIDGFVEEVMKIYE